MDRFIHWPKPYNMLLAISDGILSRVNEIGAKTHLISDGNCNILNL